MKKSILLICTLLLITAACGEDSNEQENSSSEETETTEEETTSTKEETTDSSTTEAGAMSTDLTQKPIPSTNPDTPPQELEIVDIVTGEGAEVQAGDTVTVHYVGVVNRNGQEFDSSWDREQTATFPLSGVIPGWTEGIPGMQVGGRRQLAIPSSLAYGQTPPPGSGIQAGDDLVFIVDLVEIPGN